jgi:hypothetical protein
MDFDWTPPSSTQVTRISGVFQDHARPGPYVFIDDKGGLHRFGCVPETTTARCLDGGNVITRLAGEHVTVGYFKVSARPWWKIEGMVGPEFLVTVEENGRTILGFAESERNLRRQYGYQTMSHRVGFGLYLILALALFAATALAIRNARKKETSSY